MVATPRRDAAGYAIDITYAIISIMEIRGAEETVECWEEYEQIIDAARKARATLNLYGDPAIILAALYLDPAADLYVEINGEEHPGLHGIAAKLRAYTAESTWENPQDSIDEQHAHLFALRGE